MNRNILITGGSGFIGSNFINYFINKYPNYNIINLDLQTYASNEDYNKNLHGQNNYKLIIEDICDREKVQSILNENQITDIIHFAAESHVDNSINNPNSFITTNINGTFNLIDTAYKFWKENNSLNTSRFHHISTDEVFGALGPTGFFTESSQYSPNSPYAASKASSDLIVRSYNKTYSVNTVITNCSNNYGPNQHKEKLIPKIIQNALNKETIPIYGNGENVRDWLHVSDHCRAIDVVFHKASSGEQYNIGGDSEVTNIDLAKKICNILNELKINGEFDHKELLKFTKDRLGHDFRYAIDATKIKSELNWEPSVHFEDGILDTIKNFLSLDN